MANQSDVPKIQQKSANLFAHFNPKDLLIRSLIGGLACMTPLPLMNPIEVMKVRLQLQGELQNQRHLSAFDQLYGNVKYKGFLRGGFTVLSEEGLAGLYKGIFPAAARELIYAGIRLGFYDPLKIALGENTVHNGHLPLWKKLLCGASAGTVGAAIANPFDILKVRMQGDASNPPKYKNTMAAFLDIYRNHGLKGLTLGMGLNLQRAFLVSAALMPIYDHTKSLIVRHSSFLPHNFTTQFCAAMVAGFTMTFVTSPIDVLKTRVMNSQSTSTPYKSTLSAMAMVIKKEGLIGLYKGFIPNYSRLGPHTLLAMLTYEQLRNLFGYKPV